PPTARRSPPRPAAPPSAPSETARTLPGPQRAVPPAGSERGSPAGDMSCAPPPRSFAEGWTIGQPDQVFTMPVEYTVAATGALPYQRFRVPTNFTGDKWIQAAEARPGDRSVVHHIVAYVD